MSEEKKRNELIESVRETFATGLALIEKKNRDYGASDDAFRNFRTATVVGLSVEKAILVRVLDKISRADNLLTRAAYVAEESLEDTLLDAINYLAILKAYRETQCNPKKNSQQCIAGRSTQSTDPRPSSTLPSTLPFRTLTEPCSTILASPAVKTR